MSWSYDPTDINETTSSGRLNFVRLLIGDTNTSNQQVQDEEISSMLTVLGEDVYKTAEYMARSLSAKYSGYSVVELDGALRVEYGEMAKNYRDLAESISDQGSSATIKTITISFGGTKKSQVESVRSNSDRIPHVFTMDQFNIQSDPDYQEYRD